MMAGISAVTDTSTDADTDDKTLGFHNSQALGAVSDGSDKTRDQKTLRRLAQNREAARKSRLRKKSLSKPLVVLARDSYQINIILAREMPCDQEVTGSSHGNNLLPKCMMRVAKMRMLRWICGHTRRDTIRNEDIQDKGIYVSSSGDQSQSMSGNGALAFDVEYARWLEEHNRRVIELRGAVSSHAGDGELRIIVDGILAHYDDLFRIKGNAAKADVFHILSGMWSTPAERCFLWLGGFRSSELLKLLINQLEPLTEQQLLAINNLQQSSQQGEDALSQGIEALQESLAETLARSLEPSGSSGNVAYYMGQMAMAMGKLGTLEGFIRQMLNALLVQLCVFTISLEK
ncbi:Transcription factor HBP-1b(c1) [Capsicum annuum]|nr:Transcription factor HBP-1b(c1) [Capsicum annuum]